MRGPRWHAKPQHRVPPAPRQPVAPEQPRTPHATTTRHTIIRNTGRHAYMRNLGTERSGREHTNRNAVGASAASAATAAHAYSLSYSCALATDRAACTASTAWACSSSARIDAAFVRHHRVHIIIQHHYMEQDREQMTRHSNTPNTARASQLERDGHFEYRTGRAKRAPGRRGTTRLAWRRPPA